MKGKDVRRRLISRLPKGLAEQPFQYLISWVFLLSSVNILAGFGDVPTLRGTGPDHIFLWYWVLSTLIGSSLIIWGLRRGATVKRPSKLLQAWRIERLGLILQGSSTFVLGLIVISAHGPSAILSSIMYVTLTLAYLVRLLLLGAKERELLALANAHKGD